MSQLDSYLCLVCGATTTQSSFCASCGKPLSITTDKLGELIRSRLINQGFQDLESLLQEGQKLASLASSLEVNVAQSFDKLLVFPSVGPKTMFIHSLIVVGIIHGDESSVDKTNSLAIKTYDLVKELQNTLDGLRIETIFIRLYVIYKEICSPDTVRRHKLPWRSRSSFRPSSSLDVIPIDVKRKRVYGASKYVEPDQQVKLAVKQVGELQTKGEPKSFILRFGKLLLEKPVNIFTEFIGALTLVGSPQILAYRITTDKLSPKDLLGIIAISSIFASIIAKFFSIDLGGFKFGFPLIDEFLSNLVIIITFTLSAFLNHLPLKIAKGRATFRSTFIATAYIGAVAEPLILFLIGTMILLGVEPRDAWKNAQVGTLTIAIPVYSALHQLSINRTLVVLVLIGPVALLVVFLIVIGLFGLVSHLGVG